MRAAPRSWLIWRSQKRARVDAETLARRKSVRVALEKTTKVQVSSYIACQECSGRKAAICP
jgi:hypothetical protein